MIALPAVRHLVVFRALVLGDLLCATPALRALRAGLPNAHLALCGLPWAAELAERLDSVDEFIAFPGHPLLPERAPEPGALEAFLATMRRRRFDLALQMHGSGEVANGLVREFGALSTAGFARRPRPVLPPAGLPGTAAPREVIAPPPVLAGPLDLHVPWPEAGTEIDRCLALPEGLGLPRAGLDLDFPLRDSDRRAAARLLAAQGVGAGFAVVHPGAQLPSRRWSPERFAAVADALAARGCPVVLTGTAGEAAVTAAVARAMRAPVVDLTGATSLWTLGAIVEAADLVVCNDTGVSHVAAAVRTPSVVVASGSDVHRWAPLDRRLHHVRWHATPCRPCAHRDCPTAHECATAIEPAAVIDTALELLAAARLARAGDADATWPAAPVTESSPPPDTDPCPPTRPEALAPSDCAS